MGALLLPEDLDAVATVLRKSHSVETSSSASIPPGEKKIARLTSASGEMGTSPDDVKFLMQEQGQSTNMMKGQSANMMKDSNVKDSNVMKDLNMRDSCRDLERWDSSGNPDRRTAHADIAAAKELSACYAEIIGGAALPPQPCALVIGRRCMSECV